MKKLLITLLFGVTCLSCAAPKDPSSNNSIQTSHLMEKDEHNGQNSLDWSGNYFGKTQDGSRIMYHIYDDNTFTRTLHINKDDKTITEGKIEWTKDGNHFTLYGNDKSIQKFKVIENGLSLLHDNGSESNTIFRKQSHQLSENYWKLIRLNGQSITTNDKSNAEAHIIFKSDNRIIGNGSCNRLNGQYTITGLDEISISNMSNTRMSCPNLDVENNFINTLIKAHRYSIIGDNLSIYDKDGQSLAEFTIVFLR